MPKSYPKNCLFFIASTVFSFGSQQESKTTKTFKAGPHTYASCISLNSASQKILSMRNSFRTKIRFVFPQPCPARYTKRRISSLICSDFEASVKKLSKYFSFYINLLKMIFSSSRKIRLMESYSSSSVKTILSQFMLSNLKFSFIFNLGDNFLP